jgi:hypothetical protein
VQEPEVGDPLLDLRGQAAARLADPLVVEGMVARLCQDRQREDGFEQR